MDLWWGLFGQGKLKLVEQDLELFFRLGITGQNDFPTLSGRKVDVEHLHGGELFDDRTGRQAAGTAFESGFEGDLQAVG